MKLSTWVPRPVRFGTLLGLAYIANVQVLTWVGRGLTGWVFALDLALSLLGVYLLLRSYSDAPAIGATAGVARMGVMLLLAGVLLQLYMLVYLTYVEPAWVDQVVEVRRGLLVEGQLSPREIEARLAEVRVSFTPTRMMTRGVLIPAAWKLFISLLVVVPIHRLSSRRSVGQERGRLDRG